MASISVMAVSAVPAMPEAPDEEEADATVDRESTRYLEMSVFCSIVTLGREARVARSEMRRDWERAVDRKGARERRRVRWGGEIVCIVRGGHISVGVRGDRGGIERWDKIKSSALGNWVDQIDQTIKGKNEQEKIDRKDGEMVRDFSKRTHQVPPNLCRTPQTPNRHTQHFHPHFLSTFLQHPRLTSQQL